MASFESVNYMLRPNKNVERKLLFSTLADFSKFESLKDYHYVGFGSLWYIDFIYAHTYLGIRRLSSIEYPQHEKRMRFNRPFSCIDLISGESTMALPRLDWSSKCLIWLDYDSGIDGPVFRDIPIVVQNVQVESILIMTLNAHNAGLDNSVPPKAMGNVAEKRLLGLKNIASRFLPSDLAPKHVGAKRFRKLLPILLTNCITSSLVAAGRRERFVPLFNFSYSDNAPMATLGGVITADATRARGILSKLSPEHEFLRSNDQVDISVPVLTAREKLFLDRLLPSTVPLSETPLTASGFGLRAKELDAYWRYYKHYPLFLEMVG